MKNKFKELERNAKKYNWDSRFVIKEKIKIVTEEYLEDYDNRELNREDFIERLSEKLTSIIHPE